MHKAALLTDADLVARCRAGDTSAWEHFFKRFNEYIDRQILRNFRLVHFHSTEEDFERAKNAVIDILIDPQKLAAISEPERFRGWLARICSSKARDVARARRSIKNSVDSAARRDMLSLQQPAGAKDASTLLEDSLASECPSPDCCDEDDLFSTVQAAIEALEWIYQGPLKISLLFYADFLQHSDMKRIAAERAVVLEVLQEEISCLLDELLHKYAKSIKHEAAIRVAVAYVERLKARRYACGASGADDRTAAAGLTHEIEKNEQRLAGLLARKNRPILPSNAQVGALLAQKENVIATRLFRARKALKDKLL